VKPEVTTAASIKNSLLGCGSKVLMTGTTFYPKDGGSMLYLEGGGKTLLQNAGTHLPIYTASPPRRQ
jgi:hypothetical protein